MKRLGHWSALLYPGLAALAFAAYARTYPMQDNYRAA